MVSASQAINLGAFEYFPALRKVRRYFEANYADPISIRKAAAIAGLEEKYFSHMFRCRVGIGFKEWTDVVRLEKAIDVLKREDQSLTLVALQVGFRSPVTFQRQFKKHVHMRPRDFRKSIVERLKHDS
jgi:AraC-like DNA-binding protein